MSVNNTCSSTVLSHENLVFSILSFLPECTRVNFITISAAHAKLLTSEEAFKWRATRLHIEHGVYFSPHISDHHSWRNVFLENYKRKDLWYPNEAISEESSQQKFQLTVSARFKPKGIDSHVGTMKKISLPLHQRLKLIRMNRNISSQKKAFEVLVNQGDWFGGNEDVDGKDVDERDDAADESKSSATSISGGVHLIDPTSNAAILVDRTKGLRKFEFDHVFSDAATQESVYHTTTMPLIAEFINGYNATCLVYGQTGSGKTFSMFGPHSEKERSFGTMLKENGKIPDSFGIVPRSIREIFDALEYRKKNVGLKMKAEISISYIEIYGNEVSDLLQKGMVCGQSRVSAQRYVLDGSSEVPVSSAHETLALLDEGEKQKRKAATAINARSSRAHTLFIVTLRQHAEVTGVSSTSRLFLADLGGSEQIKRSQPFRCQGVDETDEVITKQRVQEAVNINLGLLALKQCVEGLRKGAHVPYGDSKLTMMLSAGLGGDSKTSVIVCGAQEESHGPETISSMKFGQTCRGIYNTVTTNANMLQTLLENINEKISACERNIRENERWEEVDDVRYDDDGNAIETRKKTIVTGADSDRKELNNLLKEKAALTGENIDDLLKGVQGFGDFNKYTGADK